jgi:aminoacyl tRNA synthase complex-interacting multifunctional protein 1
MSAVTTLEQLKLRSVQANQVIEKLKHQVEQIKLQTTPAYMADKAKSLQNENVLLKKRVEELKKELEIAESKSGVASTPAISNPVSTASKSEKNEPAKPVQAKVEKPKQVQQPKKEQPKKAEKTNDLVPENISVSLLDIRVGKIVSCEKHPEADSLYVEKIDLGEGTLRNVCSGLVKHIPLDQMQNRLVVVLCNLKPSKLRGVMSEAMVLCASTPEKVELMEPPAGSHPGDRVTCVGFEGEPHPECNPKNNIFALVTSDLKTNDSLVGSYKGAVLEVKGKGVIKSTTLKNVPVK